MRQIGADELRFIISFELSQVPRMTLRALPSGHHETHSRALDRVTARITTKDAKLGDTRFG